MRKLVSKIKPSGGFAQVFHISLSILLPLLVFILVRIDLVELAAGVILFAK